VHPSPQTLPRLLQSSSLSPISMSSEPRDISNMMQDSISMTIIDNNENNNDISSSFMELDDQNNNNNNNNNNHQHLGMSEVDLTDYSFSLFLQTSDTDFFFRSETESPAVPVAKASHLYTKEDLKPVRCMASFLYLVFRNPNLYEVTFFKAGSRTYDETKQSDEVEKDNKRRYVTAYGTDVTHIWYVYLSSIYLFLYLFTLLSLAICGWLLGWNNFANLSILLYFFF
jgi:hypothetical protein